MTNKSTKAIFERWISAFQAKDIEALVSLYHDDAVNWQVADQPANGKAEIRTMMESFFAAFPDAYTKIENIMYDGEWASWEWTGGGIFEQGLCHRVQFVAVLLKDLLDLFVAGPDNVEQLPVLINQECARYIENTGWVH
jgi:uncharacterized protein (TIGR02246 family)